MNTVAEIENRVASGIRISGEEAVRLWHEADLWSLARLGAEAKKRVSGNSVFYNRNFHLEPSNICAMHCRFCSFRRDRGEEGAWELTQEEMLDKVRKSAAGSTEVHIVGSSHPDRGVGFYVSLLEAIKREAPHLAVKAFTAVEILHMASVSSLSLEETLGRLKKAGLESIPGGGAEIFDEGLRRRICPDKCSAEQWLEVHAMAHRMGIDSNATMLYGHEESIEQRVDHLLRLRDQQDASHGFNAFIPLKYRAMHNTMSSLGETSVIDDMRTVAMSRIILDNIPHIKAYWVMYGKPSAEMALLFGADDIDGTIEDSTRIYSMAGAEDTHPSLSVEEIERMCSEAGFKAVERDTHYNIKEKR